MIENVDSTDVLSNTYAPW